MEVQVQDRFGAPWSVPGAVGAPKTTQWLMAATGRAILGPRAMVAGAVDFLHASSVGRCRIMTSGTQGLHGTVIHSLGGKGRLTAMAERTFVAGHPRRRHSRNVIRRFYHDVGVCTTVAGLACTSSDARVTIGGWQPT